MEPTDSKQNHHSQSHSSSFSELLKFALISLIIVLPIRFYIAKPFVVSGSSMYPTFSNGEYLIVDQLSYRLNDPKRGDVVIFKFPERAGGIGSNSSKETRYLIKRVIGLPGETISIQGGKVTIINKDHPDGFVLNEPYLKNLSYDTLYDKLDDHEYFVMGDNRPSSSDSRMWGHLDEQYIVGKPIVRLLPFQKMSIKPGAIPEQTE